MVCGTMTPTAPPAMGQGPPPRPRPPPMLDELEDDDEAVPAAVVPVAWCTMLGISGPIAGF